MLKKRGGEGSGKERENEWRGMAGLTMGDGWVSGERWRSWRRKTGGEGWWG